MSCSPRSPALPACTGALFSITGTLQPIKAERINLLKRAVEKYGNGKADADLTPYVVVGDGVGDVDGDRGAAVAGLSGDKRKIEDS